MACCGRGRRVDGKEVSSRISEVMQTHAWNDLACVPNFRRNNNEKVAELINLEQGPFPPSLGHLECRQCPKLFLKLALWTQTQCFLLHNSTEKMKIWQLKRNRISVLVNYFLFCFVFLNLFQFFTSSGSMEVSPHLPVSSNLAPNPWQPTKR